MLYCLCCEEEVGPQAISAATTGQQARVVFNIAREMVKRTPDLREAFGLEAFANSIARWPVGGFFKPINAKASTQDGLNPSHVEVDEVHAHKTHDLINVLQSAQGARANPLWLYTTTEGYENAGPWGDLREFVQHILEGTIEAAHVFGIIFALDDEEGTPGTSGYRKADDEFDERAWIKANPLIDVNPILLDRIRKAAIEAKQMPGQLAEFRIKRCNRRTSTARGWVQFDRWRKCNAGTLDLEALKAFRCWGGLDLASNNDFCSLRLVWNVDGKLVTWGRSWVPEEAVKNRTERGMVPYASWVAGGFLVQTPGRVADHDVIERDILALKARFDIQAIAYDGWNAAQLAEKLRKGGMPMEQFIQGPKSYHPAMKEFERAYLSEKLAHDGSPVLTWCAANIVVRHDQNLNMAPDKKRSGDKIDEIVALLMAIGQAIKTGEAKTYDILYL